MLLLLVLHKTLSHQVKGMRYGTQNIRFTHSAAFRVVTITQLTLTEIVLVHSHLPSSRYRTWFRGVANPRMCHSASIESNQRVLAIRKVPLLIVHMQSYRQILPLSLPSAATKNSPIESGVAYVETVRRYRPARTRLPLAIGSSDRSCF